MEELVSRSRPVIRRLEALRKESLALEKTREAWGIQGMGGEGEVLMSPAFETSLPG